MADPNCVLDGIDHVSECEACKIRSIMELIRSLPRERRVYEMGTEDAKGVIGVVKEHKVDKVEITKCPTKEAEPQGPACQDK